MLAYLINYIRKAVIYARRIFDGYKNFSGIDVIAEKVLDEKQYKYYLEYREKFNKYS